MAGYYLAVMFTRALRSDSGNIPLVTLVTLLLAPWVGQIKVIKED